MRSHFMVCFVLCGWHSKKHRRHSLEKEVRILNSCFHQDFVEGHLAICIFLYHLWGNYMLPMTSKFSSSDAVVILKVLIYFSLAYYDQVVCLWSDRVPSVHFSDMWTVDSSTSILRTEKLEVVIKYLLMWNLMPSKIFQKIFFKRVFLDHLFGFSLRT